MDPNQLQTCSVCKIPLQVVWNYCPNCGQPVHAKPPSASIMAQLGLYLLSFLLPPFGLMPAIKYLKQKEPKYKIIGIVAIVLTIVSILLGILVFKAFMDQYAKVLNSFPYPTR